MPTLIDFQEYLAKQLTDPNFKSGFEVEEHKVNLQVLINEVLQKTGNEAFCVEVMDIDDY
ncbi:MAG: hypothetical protein FWG85_01975 [Bacteroidetes bacterium]|nr:hypothetical protein [Bacteroidota bacterium]